MITRQQCINILFWVQEWFNYISDALYNTYAQSMYYINSNVEDYKNTDENINDIYLYSDGYIPGPYDDIKNNQDYGYKSDFGYGLWCSSGYGYDN